MQWSYRQLTKLRATNNLQQQLNHIYLLKFRCKSWRPCVFDWRWNYNLVGDVFLFRLILLGITCQQATQQHSTHNGRFCITHAKHTELQWSTQNVTKISFSRWISTYRLHPYSFHFSLLTPYKHRLSKQFQHTISICEMFRASEAQLKLDSTP